MSTSAAGSIVPGHFVVEPISPLAGQLLGSGGQADYFVTREDYELRCGL